MSIRIEDLAKPRRAELLIEERMLDDPTERWLSHHRSDGPTVGWRRCNAVAPGEIQLRPVDVGRPSLAGDFARFCQRLVERYSLYSAAFHIRNSAPGLILPSLIDRRVGFTVFGAQDPIDQIGDCILGHRSKVQACLRRAMLTWLTRH